MAGPGEDGLDRLAVWAVRCGALVCYLCGSFTAESLVGRGGPRPDWGACEPSEVMVLFWLLLRSAGAVWLMADIACCAFWLRCAWMRRRLGSIVRFVGAALWFVALYGLRALAPELRRGPDCFGFSHVLLGVVLSVYVLIALMCCILLDCSVGFCEFRRRCCPSDWFDSEPWPALDVDSAEEAALMEMGSASTPAGFARPGVCRLGTPLPDTGLDRPAPGRTAGPSPTAYGRSARSGGSSGGGVPRRLSGAIRVLCDGEVLHVGRTRRGVKRWLRQHQPDCQGVMVEDGAAGAAPVRRFPRRVAAGAPPPPADDRGRGASDGADDGLGAAAARSRRPASIGTGSSSSASRSPQRPKQVPPLDLSSLASPHD